MRSVTGSACGRTIGFGATVRSRLLGSVRRTGALLAVGLALPDGFFESFMVVKMDAKSLIYMMLRIIRSNKTCLANRRINKKPHSFCCGVDKCAKLFKPCDKPRYLFSQTQSTSLACLFEVLLVHPRLACLHSHVHLA